MNNMSRTTKILLGIASFWPFLYIGLFLIFCLGFVLIIPASHATSPKLSLIIPVAFVAVFAVHILTILGMIALLVYYLVHLFKTDRVPQDQRVLWAVVLFLGGLPALPVYWYVNIWKETPIPISVGPLSESGMVRADRWPRQGKLVLGLLTVWPLIWGSVFGLAVPRIFEPLFAGKGSPSPEIVISAISLFAVHFATVMLMMGLLVLYLMHVGTSGRVPKNRTALWIVLIFLGNMLAMPVYWYLYIWREPQSPPVEPQSGE